MQPKNLYEVHFYELFFNAEEMEVEIFLLFIYNLCKILIFLLDFYIIFFEPKYEYNLASYKLMLDCILFISFKL